MRSVFLSLEGNVLIGHEESHELWGIEDWDASGLVDIEVTPCFGPVGVEVFNLSGTFDGFMGFENFHSESSGGGFGKGEDTGWFSIFGSTFLSVVLDDGSHEDIIRISRESWWGNSGVSSSSEFTGLSWLVDTFERDGGGGGDKCDASEFHYFNQTNYLLII